MSKISEKYADLIKNPDYKWIGEPRGGESVCPDKIGSYQHYSGSASIYWSPTTGAHLIYGCIRVKWAALGSETGPHGYPTTDEGDATSGKGRFNNFENGTIIWRTGDQEAFSVRGGVYEEWGNASCDWGELGFPTTDESGLPCGVGRFNHFDGGSIYWSPGNGARIVKGAIRNAWASQGWERSRLQFPVSDELVTEGTSGKGRYQDFEGGSVYWTPQSGAEINLHPAQVVVGKPTKNMSAGKIKSTEVFVEYSADGAWKFHAHLKDSSTYYGDYYAIGFVFEGDGHGRIMTGELGAKLSGPATSADRTVSGNDPWLRECWASGKNMGVRFRLIVDANPLSAFKSLESALKEYGGSLVLLL